jgi:hypothetical protein
MLLDPEAVVAAMNRSERLSSLQSRICRPLDRQPGSAPQLQAGEDRAAEDAAEDADAADRLV